MANEKPKTRKSLFGNKEITKSSYKNPKTKEVVKSKYVKYSDGSSKQKTVEKKPGLFGKKETTTTYRGAGSKEDMVTEKRYRKAGVLPRVKTVTKDNLMGTQETKKNLLYKLGTKKERVKLSKSGGILSGRKEVKNCLKGCASNPLNK
jgi:hypothetical protein